MRNDTSEHVGMPVNSGLVKAPLDQFNSLYHWLYRDAPLSYCHRGRLKQIFPAVARLHIEHVIQSLRIDPYIKKTQYKRDVPETAGVFHTYQRADRKQIVNFSMLNLFEVTHRADKCSSATDVRDPTYMATWLQNTWCQCFNMLLDIRTQCLRYICKRTTKYTQGSSVCRA